MSLYMYALRNNKIEAVSISTTSHSYTFVSRTVKVYSVSSFQVIQNIAMLLTHQIKTK